MAVQRTPRLCIFTRAPILGQVKTRLACTLGAELALQAHVRLVEDSLERLVGIPGVACELWIAGDPQHPVVKQWCAGRSVQLRQQVGDDLGDRMNSAVSACLKSGHTALIVGGDCPSISAAYIQSAVEALEVYDLVLGPAEDGGYGLIGLAKPAPELFFEMPWGSEIVYRQTIARANGIGLSWTALETVWDVDNVVDWQRFLALKDGSDPGAC